MPLKTLTTEHATWRRRHDRRVTVEKVHREGVSARVTLTVAAVDPADADAVALAAAMQAHAPRILAELSAQVVLAERKAEKQAADVVKARLTQDYPEIEG